MGSTKDDINEGITLSELWKAIVKDEVGSVDKLDRLLANYDNRYKHKKGDTSTIKKKSLHSISMDAYSKSITWKAFVNLLFNVINVKQFRLIIELDYGRGKKKAYEVSVLKNRLDEESKNDKQK